MDHKINEYFIGLFYALKMPTSNYIIRRFFNYFVLIETDIFFFNFQRLCGSSSFKRYILYFIYLIKK